MTLPAEIVTKEMPSGVTGDEASESGVMSTAGAAVASSPMGPVAARPDPFNVISKHLLCFGLFGPIIGLIPFVIIIFVFVGPQAALGSLVLMLMGMLFKGMTLVAAFKFGAVPALLAGLTVALLRLKRAPKLVVCGLGALVGGLVSIAWEMLLLPGARHQAVSGMSAVIDREKMGSHEVVTFLSLFLLGGGTSLLMTYVTRGIRSHLREGSAAIRRL